MRSNDRFTGLTESEEIALSRCQTHIDKVKRDNDASYHASIALQEFLGGPKAGYYMYKGVGEFRFRYWVQSPQQSIIDPMANGDATIYRSGQRVGRRNTVRKHKALLEAMRADGPAVVEKQAQDVWRRPMRLKKGDVVTELQNKHLYAAWRALIRDWADRHEEYMRCKFTKQMLALQFVQSQVYGKPIPRTATLAYTPDRVEVVGSVSSLADLFEIVRESPDEVVASIMYVLKDLSDFSVLFSTNLPVHGRRLPNDFPVPLARDLIDRYCPNNGRVLDPCHGWGGRLLGFLLSRATHYTGVDPAPRLAGALYDMFDDLKQYLTMKKTVVLYNEPFEDIQLKPASFDFAFTSPPYFNTERYNGEQSSWRRYPEAQQWVEGFFLPLLEGVSAALKPGACFALQVTPKPLITRRPEYNMQNIAKEFAPEIGLVFKETFETSMRRYNFSSSDEETGTADVFEIVAVFQRQ